MGGAVAGSAAALLLKRLGCQPVVFQSDSTEIADRVEPCITLTSNGLKALSTFGLTEKAVREAGELIHTVHAMSPGGQNIVSFPTLMSHEKYSIPMAAFQSCKLRALLHQEMVTMDIPVEHGKHLVIDIEQDAEQQGPAVLCFEDGSTSEADLVIGCDGYTARTPQAVPPR